MNTLYTKASAYAKSNKHVIGMLAGAVLLVVMVMQFTMAKTIAGLCLLAVIIGFGLEMGRQMGQFFNTDVPVVHAVDSVAHKVAEATR